MESTDLIITPEILTRFDLLPGEKILICAMKSWPGIDNETMAATLGMSDRTVYRHLKKLESLGLINRGYVTKIEVIQKEHKKKITTIN